MKNLRQLENVLEENINLMSDVMLAMPWHDQSFYERYLAETFRYVTHSCLLLKYSADKLEEGELKSCLYHHIDEEKGHEILAKRDLKFFNKSPDDFDELQVTKKIYEEMYQELDDLDPVAPLIGYSMALEGLSAKIACQLAVRLEKNFGKGCETFLKLHGEVDQEHAKEGLEILELLTEEQIPLVEDSIKKSSQRYLSFLKTIENISKKTVNAA